MTIIGIDLGTTNSACAVWREGAPKLIPNRLGEYLTPSVVGFDDSEKITVGRIAKERLISHSDKTVAVFKRLMGADHKIQIGRREFTATELSSIVLRSLKEDAEHFLNEPVTEAVISVPAYFNDNQRHATKVAGELVLKKINIPISPIYFFVPAFFTAVWLFECSRLQATIGMWLFGLKVVDRDCQRVRYLHGFIINGLFSLIATFLLFLVHIGFSHLNDDNFSWVMMGSFVLALILRGQDFSWFRDLLEKKRLRIFIDHRRSTRETGSIS